MAIELEVIEDNIILESDNDDACFGFSDAILAAEVTGLKTSVSANTADIATLKSLVQIATKSETIAYVIG